MKKTLLILLLTLSSNAISDTFDEDKNFKAKDNDVPIVYVPIVVKWFKNALPDIVWLQKLQKPIPPKQFKFKEYKDYSRVDKHPCEYDIGEPGVICKEPTPFTYVPEEYYPKDKKPENIPEPSILLMIALGVLVHRRFK